jgi:aryl-alcohol dehydrogenase-like predicted oxidoreductase
VTRLVLGTAQLGAGYGVTNAVGRLADAEVVALLEAALDGGIGLFDTATVYDDAEERLGRLMPSRGAAYVSKFELRADEEPTFDALVGGSLARLRVPSLAGVLARGIDALDARRAARIEELLDDARASGQVERYGVSVYDGVELRRAVELLPSLTFVQLPGSAVDRRLLDDPLLAELRREGVEVHVRSAFLQGLLLSDVSSLPERFAALAPSLTELDGIAARHGVPRIAVLLAALLRHPEVDAVVVGATSTTELEGILAGWRAAHGVPEVGVSPVAEELADPRRWTRPAVES